MSQVRTAQFSSRRQSQVSGGWSRNQNRARFQSNVKLGPVTHTVLVALMITVLGLIYLTQATRATTYSYQAQTIESKIADLSDQKTDLQVENARLTALTSVEHSNVASTMSTPSDTNYAN